MQKGLILSWAYSLCFHKNRWNYSLKLTRFIKNTVLLLWNHLCIHRSTWIFHTCVFLSVGKADNRCWFLSCILAGVWRGSMSLLFKSLTCLLLSRWRRDLLPGGSRGRVSGPQAAGDYIVHPGVLLEVGRSALLMYDPFSFPMFCFSSQFH